MLAGARDGKTFIIKQALNLENGFDILATIQTMTARALHGLKSRKICLPIEQNKGFCGGKAADFSDAEQTLVGNRCIRWSLSRSSHRFPYRRPISRRVNPYGKILISRGAEKAATDDRLCLQNLIGDEP